MIINIRLSNGALNAMYFPFGYYNRLKYGHLPVAFLQKSSAAGQEESPPYLGSCFLRYR